MSETRFVTNCFANTVDELDTTLTVTYDKYDNFTGLYDIYLTLHGNSTVSQNDLPS